MANVNTLLDERTIGYRIGQIIVEKGQTVRETADAMDISEMRLRAILTGSVNVQDEELKYIANKLNVTPKELLQPIPNEDLQTNNLHCMGTAADSESLNTVLDKIDMYVRLLNLHTND